MNIESISSNYMHSAGKIMLGMRSWMQFDVENNPLIATKFHIRLFQE